MYERHLADGQKFRESSRIFAQSLFNSLPRHLKNLPIIDVLVGSDSSDLYEAIFDLDVTDDIDIFEQADGDVPILSAQPSHESLSNHRAPAKNREILQISLASPSSRARNLSVVSTSSRPPQSPLARLFDRRPFSDGTGAVRAEGNIGVGARVPDRQISELQDQLKDMQVRQQGS